MLHLMIAGRLRWRDRGAPIPGKVGLAAFDFPTGTLCSPRQDRGGRRRCTSCAPAQLDALDPGGLEVLDSDLQAFAARLTRENHTLKRALTDPHIFSGIGNAYSDEILHAARLSPMKLTATLSGEEIARLYDATVGTLERWIRRLRDEAGGAFPEKVTAFREGMAVHGRYRQPCPVCGAPVQRIVYAAQRSQLLRPVPDRRATALRSRTLATAAGGLAEDARRDGTAARAERAVASSPRAAAAAVLPSRDAEESASRDRAPRIGHRGDDHLAHDRPGARASRPERRRDHGIRRRVRGWSRIRVGNFTVPRVVQPPHHPRRAVKPPATEPVSLVSTA